MLRILDTPPEAVFDETVALAARLCDTPVSLVSLVDESRQWFKAKVGTSLCETAREHAFCHRTIQHTGPYVVEDACLDPTLVDNPLVTGGPRIRFYAGVPLELSDGARIGSLCVIDSRPRQLSPVQLDSLKALGRQLSSVLDHRYALEVNRELRRRETALHEALLHQAIGDSQRRAVALHEGIAQDLVGGRMLLDGLITGARLPVEARERAQLLSELLGNAINDCRTVVAAEGTLALRDEGLAGALRHLAAPAADGSDLLEIETRVATPLPAPLSTVWEHHLYRIAELALRHARAQPNRTRIVLSLDTTPSGLRISVQDEGLPDDAHPGPTGTLLETLRFRASLLGGAVRVERAADLTRVTASVPWPAAITH